MAKLIMNSLPDRNHVAVFVANPEGKPALGLEAANFKLRPTVPGADGAYLTILAVIPSTLPGFSIRCRRSYRLSTWS